MKKTLISVCVFTMSLFSALADNEVVTPASAPSGNVTTEQPLIVADGPTWGNVNGDNSLNEDDAWALAQYLLGNTTLDTPSVADINGDKRISVSDIAKIIYYIQHREVNPDAADETPVLAPVRPTEE